MKVIYKQDSRLERKKFSNTGEKCKRENTISEARGNASKIHSAQVSR